ncbi:MAG: acyl transferase [Chitinophagaceae bacterium]|nr:MAG: acyl transferase [Chitinophagaceae bacterium]
MATEEPDILKELFKENNAAWPDLALNIFRIQYRLNEVYRQFCDILRVEPAAVNSISQIPFLPIQLFKSRAIKTGSFTPATIFESSGTTGSVNSKHLVKDLGIYEQSFLSGFNKFYGEPRRYCILGLLPSYLERGNSSLVYMVNDLIEKSQHPDSGFYLQDHEQLHSVIASNEAKGQQTLLIGVTYALLDFAENYSLQLKHTIIMETGGMKGRREELTRAQVHSILKDSFGITSIHSEYGMTELLSQAYSRGDGIFHPSDTMKILLRAEDDPFDVNASLPPGRSFLTGAMNIIDLANIHSCSFIATDDMGKLYTDGSFEVLGRLDNSDIRGCGLMIL